MLARVSQLALASAPLMAAEIMEWQSSTDAPEKGFPRPAWDSQEVGNVARQMEAPE